MLEDSIESAGATRKPVDEYKSLFTGIASSISINLVRFLSICRRYVDKLRHDTMT